MEDSVPFFQHLAALLLGWLHRLRATRCFSVSVLGCQCTFLRLQLRIAARKFVALASLVTFPEWTVNTEDEVILNILFR